MKTISIVLLMAVTACDGRSREPQSTTPPTPLPDSGVPATQSFDNSLCYRMSPAFGEPVEDCHEGANVQQRRTVENGIVRFEFERFAINTYDGAGRCGCELLRTMGQSTVRIVLEMPEGAALPYTIRNGWIRCLRCLHCSCTFNAGFEGSTLSGTIYRFDAQGIVAHISGQLTSPTMPGAGVDCYDWCGADPLQPIDISMDISLPF